MSMPAAKRSGHHGQLGFDGLLTEAESANASYRFDRETDHLPDTPDEALPFYRGLIRRHDEAMRQADVEVVMAFRREAHDLARKLNGGAPGILASDDAPGCMLERETAASPGDVPLWGQNGTFIITASGIEISIEMDGVFGIGSTVSFWPGFAARAVRKDRPFLSSTGYRSFLGLAAAPKAGCSPDGFAGQVIESYVDVELKGQLCMIADEWR